MKYKFFIFSVLLHIIVFINFSNFSSSNKKNGVKSSNINVNLTVSTMGNSNKTLAKMTIKKEEKKQEKTRKITPEKKVVKKNKNILKPKSKIAKSKKTQPKKIVKIIDTNYNGPNNVVEKNTSESELVKNSTTNDSILGKQENDKNLIKIKNGQYALKNQKVSGIHIIIQKEIPPKYPNLALKMGYRKETVVKVKFLVDKKGRVGDIKFYTSSKYGFEDEVKKALKEWIFEPIIYQDKPMPIYFYKVFHFVSKS